MGTSRKLPPAGSARIKPFGMTTDYLTGSRRLKPFGMTTDYLSDNAHLVPVVIKLPATFQADYVVAGRGGTDALPGRRAVHRPRRYRSSGGGKGLGDLAMAARDGEQLQQLFKHKRGQT